VSLRGYLQVLRERWKLVLTGLLLCLAIAAAATWTATPRYAAEVTLFVAARGMNGDAAEAYQGSLLSQQKVKSYTQLVTSDRIRRDVERRGAAVDAAAIDASVQPGTVLLTVTVTDSSPERARDVADAVAEAFAMLVVELERPTDGGQPTVTATLVEPAQLPTSPVYPRPVNNLLLGALAGLALGFATALARNALDTTVKSTEMIQNLVDAPLLGTVMFDPEVPDLPLIVHGSPGSPRSEALRHIRTNLKFIDVDEPVKTVVVTSSLPGEGKTTTACNLAITLAQAGTKVVIVDADLRRPRIGELLGVESAVGLTSVLIGHAGLDEALQPWGHDGMAVLASGTIPPNPSELLSSQHMAGLLDELKRRFDVVIVDAPPVLPVTDAAVLASRCDGVMLLVRHGKTTRNQVHATTDALKAVSARLLGTVMTMTPKSGSGEGYRYNYSYGYQTDPVQILDGEGGPRTRDRGTRATPRPRAEVHETAVD
jgi:capsular exopolysaccharide synthesis family protein